MSSKKMPRNVEGLITIAIVLTCSFIIVGCWDSRPRNTSALDEQASTEINQQGLIKVQPPPRLSWSMERQQLIDRSVLQNDRTVSFYMYVFIEGDRVPIGYYQVNKVSSVNSQLTNTEQIVTQIVHGSYVSFTLPSPAEDGSYGSNGDGVFGFTPEGVYVEHNMRYITSTVPLTFTENVPLLTVLTTDEAAKALANTKRVLTGTVPNSSGGGYSR